MAFDETNVLPNLQILLEDHTNHYSYDKYENIIEIELVAPNLINYTFELPNDSTIIRAMDKVVDAFDADDEATLRYEDEAFEGMEYQTLKEAFLDIKKQLEELQVRLAIEMNMVATEL